MPSLRKKVSTYLRQLSFAKEDRYSQRNVLDTSFITKYLQMEHIPSQEPEIFSSRDPALLPEIPLSDYVVSIESVNASITGPDNGFLGIRRNKLHLSVGSDIEFIDRIEKSDAFTPINISEHNISKSVDSNDETKIEKTDSQLPQNTNLAFSTFDTIDDTVSPVVGINNWKSSTDFAYGMSISLYEKNLVSGKQNGSPIADNFGLVSRADSAILVLADGVNWGENSKLAARAATFGWYEIG